MSHKVLISFFRPFTLLMLGMCLFQFSQANPLSAADWVDSVYHKLSDRQRIAQLFMVDAYSHKDKENFEKVAELIRNQEIGGVIFFKGDVVNQAIYTNRFQNISRVPLFIGIDGEWGLGMRLENAMSFPKQLTLGAIRDDDMIFKMGAEIGRQCKLMGIHVNFAPVADINNNPANPVINERSFGENKYKVALKSLAYADGLQSAGVMACVKHFPGHGDTDSDSHVGLPTISKSLEQIKALEFFPFQILFANGVKSAMAAHLYVPALDNRSGLASSLSEKITSDWMKDSLGFNGLVFSDALNMKAVSKYFMPGELELKALKAGNDVLLFSENVPVAIDYLLKALESGTFSTGLLETKVKKLLQAKYDAGLFNRPSISLQNLNSELNTPYAESLRKQLFRSAVTLASDEQNMVPIKNPLNGSIACLSIGGAGPDEFDNTLDLYAPISHYRISKDCKSFEVDSVVARLQGFETVIVAVHEMSRKPESNFGLSPTRIAFIQSLIASKNVILCLFGSPYTLKEFSNKASLLVAYEDNDASREAAALAIFGAIPLNAKLPVSANSTLCESHSETRKEILGLKYDMPELHGMSSKVLQKIDEQVRKAIDYGATPGCQVLVAKDNAIVFNKAYGWTDYSRKIPVTTKHLYDIASITKIAATTLAIMHLHSSGQLQLDEKVGDILKISSQTDVSKLSIKQLLLHETGLPAFIPFYAETIQSDSVFHQIYKYKEESNFLVPVADHLFIRNDYPELIWNKILQTKTSVDKKYLYSDLNMYILRKIVEAKSGKDFENYLTENVYKPMHLSKLCFNPIKHFPMSQLVPTENDKLFRKQLIQGYVHDPGAAMMGGVSGHAGLFSNALDLAQIMQLYLNNGQYNQVQYLDPSSVKLFTSKQSTISRRGYGFDKPEMEKNKTNPCADETPASTFGHTGFTGTCAWADPDNQLIFIFLSNRVHPDAGNNKLVQMGLRSEIQKIIYESLAKP